MEIGKESPPIEMPIPVHPDEVPKEQPVPVREPVPEKVKS